MKNSTLWNQEHITLVLHASGKTHLFSQFELEIAIHTLSYLVYCSMVNNEMLPSEGFVKQGVA